MSKPFKPLKPANIVMGQVDYTNAWLSPKLDGIRAVVRNSVVLSYTQIPIPNKYVQHLFGRPEFEHYDGELIVGDPCSPTVYNDTYRGTMKVSGEADVKLFAFDHFEFPNEEYHRRLLRLSSSQHVQVLTQHGCENEAQLLDLEDYYLGMGYEGVMIRAHSGPRSLYKYGRSTVDQGTLLRLKRLEDFEAQIVGYEEEQFNGNEATIDGLGRTKRSSHKENKVGKGTLGKLIMRYEKNGLTFKVGIFKGMTAKDKQDLWDARETLPGQWAKLQKLPIGEIDRPRQPRVTAMLGLRSPIDM